MPIVCRMTAPCPAPVTRLTDADRALMGRARAMADATGRDAIRAYFAARGDTDGWAPGSEYPAALGIAQHQLDELLRIIARLDGAP